jgi:iron complex outermembrane receptor protein
MTMGAKMKTLRSALLLGGAIWAVPVQAQTTTAADGTEVPTAPQSNVPAEEEIVVFGRGSTRQVQDLDTKELTILAPGTSPLKAIQKLPSVNVQSSDPFGAYEWSQRVSIRSFNAQQLGYTLDGIPLGDASYGNVNGLHISRAITPENIRLTRVSQGAGSLGTQATNNLGGTLEFFSRDPASLFGVEADATYGSDDTKRGFMRVDTGSLGPLSAYGSYAYLTTDKWKGSGEQKQHHLNGKAIADLGSAKLIGTFSYSDRAEQDYQDLSLEMIDRLGYDWDNTSDDYQLAILLADIGANRGETGATPTNPGAGKIYPEPFETADDAYFDASGLRRDYLGSLGLEVPLGRFATAEVRGYYHDNKGQGLWVTPYTASPSGVPISIRSSEYDIARGGVFGSVRGEYGAHRLRAGGWVERNRLDLARRFYGYSSRTAPDRDVTEFQEDPFFTQWQFEYDTKTYQYFVEDVIDLGRAKLALGWKGFKVLNEANPVIKGPLAEGKFETTDWFQPHVGATYELSSTLEMFGGFTQATRAFVSSGFGGPFGTTQAGFDAIRGTLKPETSDTYELGARLNRSRLKGTAGLYYVNFKNRLIGLATGAGIVGNPAVLQNVGSVRTWGVEVAGEAELTDKFSLYAAYSYADATYRDDVVNAVGTIIAATNDKRVADTPEHMLKGEAGYDDGALFARVSANYMSKRFFTYENDQSVPGRAILDASVGYRLSGALRKVEVQLNATNLLDKRYIATINSNGFGNRGDRQTLLTAAPRQVFVTLRTGL